MFDYNLKPYEMFGYPFFFGVLAVVVARTFPSPEMNVFLWAFEFNVAFVGIFYLWSESCKYVDGQATPDAPKKVEVEKLNIPNLNLFAQVSIGVRFDVRRNLARALLGEWEHHGAIDATESAWLKPRINSQDPRRKLPKRWQGKDAEFRLCKQDWEQAGILGRENPENNKSPFIVRDVEKLRTIVTGR